MPVITLHMLVNATRPDALLASGLVVVRVARVASDNPVVEHTGEITLPRIGEDHHDRLPLEFGQGR